MNDDDDDGWVSAKEQYHARWWAEGEKEKIMI